MLTVGVQIYSRLMGAWCALFWCIGATIWGFYVIDAGLPFRFFFLPKDPYLFGLTMAAFSGYCFWKLVQAIRLNKKPI